MSKTRNLFVTDLDGTLLNENAELTEYSRNKLNELMERCDITYFTARSYNVAKKLLHGVNWKLPCVVNNGAFIIDNKTGNIIESYFLDSKIVSLILREAEKLNVSFVLLCIFNDEEKMIYQQPNNRGVTEFIEQRKRKKDKRLLEWHNNMNIESMDVFSMQFIDEFDKLVALQSKIQAYDIIMFLDKEIYVDGYYYLNINNSEATKEKALVRITELLGYTMNEVTVFGDQVNDILMLHMAGVGVAVENANKEVKDVADEVIGCNKEDSVVRYIHKKVVK